MSDRSVQAPLSWADIRDLAIAVPEHVVFRALAEETVLLNVQSGQYYGIDLIGARFFEAARDAPRLADAIRVLAEQYEQPAETIEADLTAFCEGLQSNGLIELVRSPA